MPFPLLACVIASAIRYDLPPRVLPVIQRVEGGVVGMVHPNKDGSSDLGIMQINTRWIQTLAAVAHLPETQTAARLVSDSCFNVAAAALILRTLINQEHGNVMQAIGDYHSHTPALNESYRQKVLDAAQSLFPNTEN